MSTPKKIIERSGRDSQRQIDTGLGAYAETTYDGRGVIMRAGDVINLPSAAGEVSPIEAIGSAWITASGRI